MELSIGADAPVSAAGGVMLPALTLGELAEIHAVLKQRRVDAAAAGAKQVGLKPLEAASLVAKAHFEDLATWDLAAYFDTFTGALDVLRRSLKRSALDAEAAAKWLESQSAEAVAELVKDVCRLYRRDALDPTPAGNSSPA